MGNEISSEPILEPDVALAVSESIETKNSKIPDEVAIEVGFSLVNRSNLLSDEPALRLKATQSIRRVLSIEKNPKSSE